VCVTGVRSPGGVAVSEREGKRNEWRCERVGKGHIGVTALLSPPVVCACV